MTGAIPRTIGSYRLVSTLGRGGMGVVYRARDLELDRDVALKVLAEPLASQPEYVQRLLREARAAAAVDHEGIVHIYRAGEADGAVYIAMQLVEGQTLAQALREQGALPWPLALRILREAAKALQAAHRHGLVHRDIKPDNIMLQAEDPGKDLAQSATVELDEDLQPKDAAAAPGTLDLASARVKLMDFGLARSADGGRITRDGSYLGTPEYSSPEQCETGELDGRSDLYSLGVVLYECLTGRLPHRADTPLALFDRIRRETPVPPSQVPGCERRVPSAVEALCLHLLAKRPQDRPASAGELVALVDRVLLGEPLAMPVVRAAEPRRRALSPRRLKALGLVGALTLLAAVLAWWQPWSAGPSTWDVPRVMVEDFENRTGKVELDWLKIGAPDLLITALMQVGDLQVISRDRARVLYETGERADYLVQGRVFEQGGVVVLNVQVQEARLGTVKMAEKFAGRMDNGSGLFGLLDSASGWLSAGIVRLRPRVKLRLPDMLPMGPSRSESEVGRPAQGGWSDLLAMARTQPPGVAEDRDLDEKDPFVTDLPSSDLRRVRAKQPEAAGNAPPSAPALAETATVEGTAAAGAKKAEQGDLAAGLAKEALEAGAGEDSPLDEEKGVPDPARAREQDKAVVRQASISIPLPEAARRFYLIQADLEAGRISAPTFIAALRALLAQQPALERVSGVCTACEKFPEVRANSVR